ncbi:MAG: carboxypeptidase regulatory-like domain-containing protein [Deltaproteobacteria bacterium]|nr:carboxypeptidase regulatory-like domain-containing protein [Deltaproteobacteria bacterium]
MIAASVAAAPTIDIRAKTQLALEKVASRGEGVAEVSGQLVDRLTGDGLGGQTVNIRVGTMDVSASTQPDGRFRAVIAVEPGPQPIELTFTGGALLEGSTQMTVADPSRVAVSLAIFVDPLVSGPDPQLRVNASADGKDIKVEVALEIGTAIDPALKPLRTIESGTDFVLTRALAGGAGTRRLRATFAGDSTRQAATAEVTLELTAPTQTTMELSATELAYEDDLVVTGQVTDADGQPVGRAAVTLVTGDRRLAQGATAAGGSYRFEIEAEIIGQGQFGIKVLADPGSTFVKASEANPVVVRIAAPQPVPVSYTIAAFIATLGAAGGFFLARAKPWKKLRKKAPAAEVPSNNSEIEQITGGLVANKPTVMSTLRRPNDDGFSGVVRDTVRSRPVADAVVFLVLGDVEREIRASSDGSFVLEKLEPGEWKAEVAAPGHVTERFGVSIPHRGELRGVRIDLVPVRERVFQLYRRAAEPVLPEPRLWGIWSPRQIVDHVKSKRQSPALAELTDFVEEIYFSPRLAAETVLPQASERVERALRERRPAA